MQARLEFWARHVEALERESVSTKRYAQRHGLAVHRLYYWRQKIRETAAQKSEATDRCNAFVALRLEQSVAVHQSRLCTLTLGEDMRVEFSTPPAPEWLAALKHVLKGAN